MYRLAAFAVPLLLATAPAFGWRIYQCEDSGQVYFSDTPCPVSGAQSGQSAPVMQAPPRRRGNTVRTYRCEQDGEVIFSQTACTDDQEQREASYYVGPTGTGGISAQNQQMLREREARQERKYQARERSTERFLRNHLGHRDELEIKRLERQKARLNDELGRLGGYGLGNLGKADALASQIRGIDMQIQQIRANPSGY